MAEPRNSSNHSNPRFEEARRALDRKWALIPLTDQGRIAGPIKFRGWRRGADMRCYSWWVRPEKQRRRADDVSWRTENLAWLPKEDREWKTIPGHEP
mgnify:CR=1 FL=1